jgi:uncharacterized NAD(P)/FAD-binding protein YdhS
MDSTQGSGATARDAGLELGADVAIIGFGFAGLATLIHLVRGSRPRTIAIVAPDPTGLGLAYHTDDPLHLLNVPAERMGAWASAPGDFAGWLDTPAAAAATRQIGVELPGPEEFAPRALFARYLSELRDEALREAAARSIALRWIDTPATGLRRVDGGYAIRAGTRTVRARAAVLCTGNDPRAVFGELRHPALHLGPWELTARERPRTGPVALIGSGLTAVDSVLTLRGLGYGGEIVALSRNGLLPRGHLAHTPVCELAPERLAGIDRVAAVSQLVRDLQAEGHDWRTAIDALRPHTPELWQRLPTEEQRVAIKRWGPLWSVLRHRMAPAPAAKIEAELAGGALRVLATRQITPEPAGDRLALAVEPREGAPFRLHPESVIDCTGPQLDLRRSDQPLLRSLVADGIAEAHPTGLGLSADAQLRVAPGLFAVGALLTGQRWETIAVPELREQAASVAEQLGDAVRAQRGVGARPGDAGSYSRRRG